jgi:hypothetical protein
MHLQYLVLYVAQASIGSSIAISNPYNNFRSVLQSSELHAWLEPGAASQSRIPGAFEAEAERFIDEARFRLVHASSDSEYPSSFSGPTLTGLYLRERFGRLINSTAHLLNSTALVPFENHPQSGKQNSSILQRRLRGRTAERSSNSTALVIMSVRNDSAKILLPNTAGMPSLPTTGEGDSFLDGVFDAIVKENMLLPATFFQQPDNCSSRGVTLMSGSDRNTPFIEDTVANHISFAQRVCYDYWWHKGNMAAPRQPYWSKIAMLRHALQQQRQQEVLVWIDDDVVFTNFKQNMLDLALSEHPNDDIIVTTDASRKIALLNTGIIIVRRTERAKELLDEVWARGLRGRRGVSLAFASQDHCLHEQEALQEMYLEGYPGIAVINQRNQDAGEGERSEQGFNLNTFLRWSHFNSKRQLHQRFPDDSTGSKWGHGDFTGHCSGMSTVRRAVCVSSLLASVVGAVPTAVHKTHILAPT